MKANTKIEEGAVFLNTDGHRLFFTRPDRSVAVKKYHSPYCLVICNDNSIPGSYPDATGSVIARIEERLRNEGGYDDEDRNENNGYAMEKYESPYRFIMADDNGRLKHTNPRIYRSFHNPNVRYRCIELHTTKSYKVPDVSTALFTDFGLATAEFDVPYRERVLVDLQGDDRLWHLDTSGEPCELMVLAYDIEVTQAPDEVDAVAEEKKEGKDDDDKDDETDDKKSSGPSVDGSLPVDIIGYASFKIRYRARRDPVTGKCEFEMLEMPDWNQPEIVQLVAENIEQEAENHVKFIEVVEKHHMLSGHNIMGYDNIQWVNRLKVMLGMDMFKGEAKQKVDTFVNTWTRTTKIFSYGDMKEVVDIYPLSFDTYFASRRLYSFMDDYRLKSLATGFGYVIPDRVYLDAINIRMDTPEAKAKTLKYNEHDVREQLGLTVQLLPDAMRLCHMSGLTFNDCLPAGTTKIWDSMTHIQAHRNRRIMPATVQAMAVCEEMFHRMGTRNPKTKLPYTKKEIFEFVRKAHKTTRPFTPKPLKLAKYGPEMPDYMQYPQLIYNPYNKDRLHSIASPACSCYECQKIPFEIRNCDCGFCLKVRARFPQGLDIKSDRDEQVEFIVEELKALGHTEPEDVLEKFADASRGYRNKKEGYHFPGGMALHPDWPQINSHFKMWWGMAVCDVGSMYPSNLSAEDIGGDTTRFASPDYYVIDGCNIKPKNNSFYRATKESYYWIYMKRIRKDILDNFMVYIPASELAKNPVYAPLTKEYPFVKDGYLIAIVVDHVRGGAPFAMEAVLDITADIKRNKGMMEQPDSGATDMMKKQIAGAYQSMKGLRNSGSVDASRRVKLISPEGEQVDINIEKFYEMFDDVDIEYKNVDGIIFQVRNIERFGWKGLAVIDGGKVVETPVVNVIRHSYDGDMIDIYANGRRVGCLTPNHSLLSFGPNRELQKVLPEVCDKGIFVVWVEWGIGFFAGKNRPDEFVSIPFDINHARVRPSGDYVYDLEMKDVHNFVDGSGLLVVNTHGILSAPMVSCRQFCLSGASRITTLGQCVLEDAMNQFNANNFRTCYGDTDGIYATTSCDARTIPAMVEIFGLEEAGKGECMAELSDIKDIVKGINYKWQTKLKYPTYELEVEWHDGMLFVKHKTYLIFDHVVDKKTGKKSLKMKSKGNPFKSKDKPKFTVDILERVMFEVVKEHLIWSDEDREYLKVRTDIKEKSRRVVDELDMSTLPMTKFQVRQGVAPIRDYKQMAKACVMCNGDRDKVKSCAYCAGTGHKLSAYASRTNGIEHVLGQRIKTRVALMCVVCNNPLPCIPNPRKSASKPLAYLWPVDLLDRPDIMEQCGGIDYEWYKYAGFNYIKGAFGFDTWYIDPWICTMKQMTLDGAFKVKLIPGAKYADKNVFAGGGKIVDCNQELFDRLRSREPVPDDIMELLFADEHAVGDVMGMADAMAYNPWEVDDDDE